MELELRIRQEINAGGTQTAEQITGTASSRDGALQLVEGECEQYILQSTADTDLDRGLAEPATITGGTEPTAEIQREQPTQQGRFGETGQADVGDEQDTITGWEQERETFFSAQAEVTRHKLDSLSMDTHQLSSIGSDIIRLGRSVESLGQSAPVTDATTQIVVHERKRGHGHKKDDHESQEFKMTM